MQRLESLRVFGIVDEPYERLSQLAGLVGSNLKEPERLIAVNGLETFDKRQGNVVFAPQVEKGRLVGRQRLCRGDLVLATFLLEV